MQNNEINKILFFFKELNIKDYVGYSAPNRVRIKSLVYNENNIKGYINLVYADDLIKPIAKAYFSLLKNGIEFVSQRYFYSDSILEGQKSFKNIEQVFCDWDVFISDIALYDRNVIDKNSFIKLIGLGCILSSSIVITNKYHRSKLSSNIFIQIAKEFKNLDYINFNSIIQKGFNEIEKNEIISIYEKKLIFQRILDNFISS